MPRVRVHNLAMSLDGYAAGPDQSLDNPLGVGGRQLHEWAFETRTMRRLQGMEGGTEEGLDEQLIAEGIAGIGATIVGRNMFGPVRGPWKGDERSGWWGAIVPLLLGRGERLFDNLDGATGRYECVELVSSPAVTHARLSRT